MSDEPRKLPVEVICGKEYFRDDRLRQFRNVDNPHDFIDFDKVDTKCKKTFCDMIDESIADEDKGIKEYNEVLKIVPEHERMEEGWILNIIKQEVEHKETLEKIKSKLCWKKRV